jgi:hypothetical protein
MSSMGSKKYLEIVWMYVIGVVFISAGLYMIIFLSKDVPIYAPMGFVLMIPGLFFSTIGGFYGTRKLIQDQSAPTENRQMDQIKQNVVSQLKPVQGEDVKKLEAEKEPFEGRPTSEGRRTVVGSRPQSTSIETSPSVHNKAAKAEPPKEAEEPAAQEAVKKVMVCPGCDFENPPSNMFCSNCGKRLKAGAKKAAAAKKKAK